MKAGIYSPAWSSLGDSEKVLAVVAERLLARGWEVLLYGDSELDLVMANTRLSVDLTGVRTVKVRPILDTALDQVSRLSQRAARVIHGRTAFGFARRLDLLVHAAAEVPPACAARCGLLFAQFPHNPDENIILDQNGAPLRAVDTEKLSRLRSWDHIVCPSRCIQRLVAKKWRVDSQMVYPPAECSLCQSNPKQQIILTVGRPCSPKQSKKYQVMIQAFKTLCDNGLRGWKLQIINTAAFGKSDQALVTESQIVADGYPVEAVDNLSLQQILPYYSVASVYWHASGASQNAISSPNMFDHYATSVVEAMASGAVPVVFDQGSPSEIVRDGKDGRLWHDANDLSVKTLGLISNPDILEKYRESSMERAKEFSRSMFEERIDELISRFERKAAA